MQHMRWHARPGHRIVTAAALLVAAVATGLAPAPAGADTPAAPSTDEAAWLAGLQQRIIADLAAGRPLVIQVHVPLCDSSIIRCGGHGLGDGDDPERNLYWATSEGFLGWFGRSDRRRGRNPAWRLVLDGDGATVGLPDVLDVRVWRRAVPASAAWRAAGAPAQVPVFVVAYAWRGTAIDAGLAAYARDLYGDRARPLRLADGTTIATGGAAQLVAYVGHNRLMDLAGYDWARAGGGADVSTTGPRKGTIAIACHTAAYMKHDVPAPRRVPLVMTADFLMASAPTLDGAVTAFAAGGDYRAIRRGAAQGYADGSGKPLGRVQGAFTNPSDRRWRKEPAGVKTK